LWRYKLNEVCDIKYYRKDTLRTYGEVLRYQKVPPRLGKGLGEEYNLISKDWGCDGVEMGFEEGLTG